MEKLNIPVVVGIVLITILVSVGGIYLLSNNVPAEIIENSDSALEIEDSDTYDWGEIKIDDGDLEKSFVIKNTGTEDLEVANFVTSCACTTVHVSIDGEQSEKFGMHSLSEWKGVIKPEQEAEIIVIYDPMYHGKDGTGYITRTATFETNDQNNKEVELKISGQVNP